MMGGRGYMDGLTFSMASHGTDIFMPPNSD